MNEHVQVMHCCACGRDMEPSRFADPRQCPHCGHRTRVTVAECLECQRRAVVPREKWLCRPHEQEAGQ